MAGLDERRIGGERVDGSAAAGVEEEECRAAEVEVGFPAEVAALGVVGLAEVGK